MAPPFRGRGGSSGGFRSGDRGGFGGMKRGSKVIVEPHHIHEGIFIAKGKEGTLVTKNLVSGEALDDAKRLTVQNEDGTNTNTEYRIWNPFHSNLAATVLRGVDKIWIKPGAKVLYLGAATGTIISDVSDIVGPTGVVYAVQFSYRSERDLFNTAGWDLVNIAKKRSNVVPIIGDARRPAKYRMLIGVVDVIFSEVARPDQAKILALNAWYYLKIGGHFIISIKANAMNINPLVPAKAVLYAELDKLRTYQLKPEELVYLDTFARDHVCIVGSFRMPKKDDE